MLVRSSLVTLRPILRGQLKRWQSGSASPQEYHPKVRAIPFAVSPDDIATRLRFYTALYIWYYGSKPEHRPGLLKYFSVLDLSSSEPTGNSPLRIQTRNVQAIYLPVWLIDASIAAGAEYRRSSDWQSMNVTITSELSYMPGFVHEPLSRIALKSDVLTASAAVPFSDDLRTQHGLEITCLPFTHTPFPLLSLSRQMSDTYWHVGPTFRIKPSTATATMMAAYPVLVPVYLVEHELQGTASFTVILEAADPWGYYINDDYFRLLAQGRVSVPSTRATTGSLLSVSPVINAIQYMKTFTNITCGPLPPKPSIGITQDNVTGAVSQLINDAAFSEGAMAAYENRYFSDSAAHPSQPIDWDDLRIRQFNMGEVWTNGMWARLDAQRHGIGLLLRRVKEHSDESGLGERVLPTPLRSAHEWIDKETNDDRPAWLKQWHARPDKKDDGFA